MTTKKKNGFLQYLIKNNNDDDNEDDETDLTFVSLGAMHFIEEEEANRVSRTTRDEAKRTSQTTLPANTIFVRNRLEWELNVTHFLEEVPDAFVQLYRMPHESFVKLCGIIEPFVRFDPKMSKVQTGGKSPVTVGIILHCLLRWLGGGSCLDIQKQ